MGFFDIVVDILNPKILDSLGKARQMVQASKKIGKNPSENDAEAFVNILKKGGLKAAEKKVKNDLKRMRAALRVKSALPENTIDKLEQKVLSSYKKERKKGLEPSECKATLKAIRDLEHEVARHEKELNEYANSAFLARRYSHSIVRGYKDRHRLFSELRNALSDLLRKPEFGLISTELGIYFISCRDLAKYFKQAETLSKKLGVRAMKDARLGVEMANYASNQHFYIRSSDYLEDLEDRI